MGQTAARTRRLPTGAMTLYLDEDSSDPHLVGLLQSAGHDVIIPATVNMLGKSDPRQLLFAFSKGRVLLTHNHWDFEDLHDLIIGCGGAHFGILSVREDDNPKHTMQPRHIVGAIGKL